MGSVSIHSVPNWCEEERSLAEPATSQRLFGGGPPSLETPTLPRPSVPRVPSNPRNPRSFYLRSEVPYVDLIPAGIAEEPMVRLLREKDDKRRRHRPGPTGTDERIERPP